ncbi:MAG: phenylalanine--tRNA ligase subunit alpha [Endomicrobia bacterium]|nr:phenylalanine--tRNA ligase subunit alpha [Endomicrobiia bacterium]
MNNQNLNREYIEQVKRQCLEELNSTTTLEELESIRVKYIGRNGVIRNIFSKISEIPLEERKKLGYILNETLQEIDNLLNFKMEQLKSLVKKTKQERNTIELTLPAVNFPIGKLHPLTKTYNEILEIFLHLGFSVEYGPEIETEDNNFTMLNIPYDHPARDMQDTLYLDIQSDNNNRFLLRTHTSPVQIRVMLSRKPPIKSIMPGRVYRHENIDASHLFNFHQVEGLMVDEGVKLSDLKGVLLYFVKSLFGKNVKNRFRQSYFPFTEPSLEMDIQCVVCDAKGCSVCKNSGFVEILGCGMVHPQVLKNVGLDYRKYTGFAFGLGVERIAMLKFRIDDIRLFYENDLRFLKQF